MDCVNVNKSSSWWFLIKIFRRRLKDLYRLRKHVFFLLIKGNASKSYQERFGVDLLKGCNPLRSIHKCFIQLFMLLSDGKHRQLKSFERFLSVRLKGFLWTFLRGIELKHPKRKNRVVLCVGRLRCCEENFYIAQGINGKSHETQSRVVEKNPR